MSYTILNSNGTVLTTIQDGTINTTSTSLALPGRNYAGYGQAQDQNFVYLLQSFAANIPPPNPVQGQLWFNTNTQTLYVCPAAGVTSANAWISLTATSSGGTTTFGAVNVTGNITAGNLNSPNGTANANLVSSSYLAVSVNGTIANLITANANIGNLTSANITAGNATTSGNLTGIWTVNGTSGGAGATAMTFNTGGIAISNSAGANLYGIKCDNYMYANGDPISFAGTYSNANVQAYLATANIDIQASSLTTSNLTTGANSTTGTITGRWSLTTGSRIIATYADLAERFAADDVYDAGTVVSLGGAAEITAVKYELSDDVFGVISDSAAYLMNGAAGNDMTHPAVAVSGRVPVKVTGIVKKGDRLVSAGDGIARAAHAGEATPFNVIGRSLENKDTAGIGFVEAFVSIK